MRVRIKGARKGSHTVSFLVHRWTMLLKLFRPPFYVTYRLLRVNHQHSRAFHRGSFLLTLVWWTMLYLVYYSSQCVA